MFSFMTGFASDALKGSWKLLVWIVRNPIKSIKILVTFGGIIVAVVMSYLWYNANSKKKALEMEMARQKIYREALADSVRILKVGNDTLYARLAIPDTDSLKAFAGDDIIRYLRRQNAELEGLVEFLYEQQGQETSGSVTALNPPAENSHAGKNDTLTFFVSDSTDAYLVEANLKVYDRRLDYLFRVFPDKQKFRIYTVRTNNGALETWVDAPGWVERISTYSLTESVMPPPPVPRWSLRPQVQGWMHFFPTGEDVAYAAVVGAGPSVSTMVPANIEASLLVGIGTQAVQSKQRSGLAVGLQAKVRF